MCVCVGEGTRGEREEGCDGVIDKNLPSENKASGPCPLLLLAVAKDIQACFILWDDSVIWWAQLNSG